jgi:hypothetical protein
MLRWSGTPTTLLGQRPELRWCFLTPDCAAAAAEPSCVLAHGAQYRVHWRAYQSYVLMGFQYTGDRNAWDRADVAGNGFCRRDEAVDGNVDGKMDPSVG